MYGIKLLDSLVERVIKSSSQPWPQIPSPQSPPPSHTHLGMESIIPFYRRYAFEATLKGTSLVCLFGGLFQALQQPWENARSRSAPTLSYGSNKRNGSGPSHLLPWENIQSLLESDKKKVY